MVYLLYDAMRMGGYASIFVISIIGNAIPFVSVPYLAVVYLYCLKIPEANPLLIGILSGIGGSIGKMIVYTLGRGTRVILRKETADRYERIGKLLRNYGALAAFLLSVTPSPDDAIILPLGLMKYDVVKLFAGVTLGKVIISTITAYAGIVIGSISENELITETVLSVVLFAVVIILLIFLDWEKMLTTLGEKGVKGLLLEVKRNGVTAVLKSRRSDA